MSLQPTHPKPRDGAEPSLFDRIALGAMLLAIPSFWGFWAAIWWFA